MPAYRAQQRAGRSFLRKSDTLRDRNDHLQIGAMEIINKGLRMFLGQELKDDLFWDVSPPQNLFAALIKVRVWACVPGLPSCARLPPLFWGRNPSHSFSPPPPPHTLAHSLPDAAARHLRPRRL